MTTTEDYFAAQQESLNRQWQREFETVVTSELAEYRSALEEAIDAEAQKGGGRYIGALDFLND